MSSLTNHAPLPDESKPENWQRKEHSAHKDPVSIEGLEDFFVPLTQAVIDGGLTVKQAADYYGLATAKVKQLIRSGEIPACRVMTYKGKKWRVFPGGLPDHIFDALSEFQSRRHCAPGKDQESEMTLSFEPPATAPGSDPWISNQGIGNQAGHDLYDPDLLNFDPRSFADDQAGLIADLMSLTLQAAFGKHGYGSYLTCYDEIHAPSGKETAASDDPGDCQGTLDLGTPLCQAESRPRKPRQTRQERLLRQHAGTGSGSDECDGAGENQGENKMPTNSDVIQHLILRIKDLEDRLQTASFRAGYLEGQIAAMQDAQRVLAIRAHKTPWWMPLLRLVNKQNPCH